MKAAIPSCLSRVGMTWKERVTADDVTRDGLRGFHKCQAWASKLNKAWESSTSWVVLELRLKQNVWPTTAMYKIIVSKHWKSYPSVTHPLYCHCCTNINLEEADFSHYCHWWMKLNKKKYEDLWITMYLHASVHCLFCHPHSDRTLGNGNERDLDVDGINKTQYTHCSSHRHGFTHEAQSTHYDEYFTCEGSCIIYSVTLEELCQI